MQATVRAYDDVSRSGSVVLDDGTELPFDARVFAASGARLLRVGQRMKVRVDGDGPGQRVTAMSLVTFPLPD